MHSFYDEHEKECMCDMDMTEGQTNETICDDFSCLFEGTKLCVEESCNRCKLNNCRVCRHLFECFERVEQD